MKLRLSGNHLLWPQWVTPAGNTAQWILPACTGVGGTVFRKKVARKKMAHGTDLHNCVALFALLCQMAQDTDRGVQAQAVQPPQQAGKLQCRLTDLFTQVLRLNALLRHLPENT